MSFIIFLLGLGSSMALIIPFFIWFSNKFDSPIDRSIYRSEKDKGKQSGEKKQKETQHQSLTHANPSDTQIGFSYDAKMNVFMAVCVFLLAPLCFSPIVFLGMNLNQDGFSEELFGLVIIWDISLTMTLILVLYRIVGHSLQKRLPRYSAKGTVAGKEIVSVRTGKSGFTRYCVLSIFLEADAFGTDFYTPQELYETVSKSDSVSLVYHQLSSKRLVIDTITFNSPSLGARLS